MKLASPLYTPDIIKRRGLPWVSEGQGRAGVLNGVSNEDFFLTLYFYDELAAGPVVGSVIGSVTNHMLSFRKVRTGLWATKCHPAGNDEEVTELLRERCLELRSEAHHPFGHCLYGLTVSTPGELGETAGDTGGMHDTRLPGDGTISRIFHQRWVPVYASG